MVVDLQGVDDWYTDPVVLTAPARRVTTYSTAQLAAQQSARFLEIAVLELTQQAVDAGLTMRGQVAPRSVDDVVVDVDRADAPGGPNEVRQQGGVVTRACADLQDAVAGLHTIGLQLLHQGVHQRPQIGQGQRGVVGV